MKKIFSIDGIFDCKVYLLDREAFNRKAKKRRFKKPDKINGFASGNLPCLDVDRGVYVTKTIAEIAVCIESEDAVLTIIGHEVRHVLDDYKRFYVGKWKRSRRDEFLAEVQGRLIADIYDWYLGTL